MHIQKGLLRRGEMSSLFGFLALVVFWDHVSIPLLHLRPDLRALLAQLHALDLLLQLSLFHLLLVYLLYSVGIVL